MAEVSEKARTLHSRMLEAPVSKLFSQEELLKLMNLSDVQSLLEIAQELVSNNLAKLMKVGEELKFQVISLSEAKKITSMSDDEAMIYSYIEASGREGIWTKTIKAKTNLHQHIVVRCLKSLEGQRYIKSIKSVKHPTRKIYMLYNLQPSIEVTGGPWFTDSELDTEFIDSLTTVIWRFVASKSYPTVFQPPSSNTNVFQSSFPATHTGYINLESIMEFITSNRITNIELAVHDIRALCDVLIYEDKLELVVDTADLYKATWQSVLEAGYGRAYEEGDNQSLVNPKFLKDLKENKSYSIFDHYSIINDEKEESDLSYFDAWAYD
ncbi:34-kDa subunit of RNA polymerase III (C) [Hyphopichia burtonii NRRL Y-1933]|uniref:DNA-directed RNA polymerase III subunit RPC6 n=1 Tax=Hyphopichia burtonii NRRL Y-1933 TaxID=984485 RepID=A0A1E4RRT3_9ASCO|nr:34-kDa subunit of RNA polymerase III (C) [Hyphopichia burtonii NRRL Y-1933]ODV69990.1 34-kDa subunit of RNA polymerase III (C) [Hyphopichia burtonii NRRL Y-1933]